MAAAPSHHGFNVYTAYPDEFPIAGQLHGNVLRIARRWADWETGPYIFNQAALVPIKQAVDAARLFDPDAKAVVIFLGPVPTWAATMYPDQVVPGVFNVGGGYRAVKYGSAGQADLLSYYGNAAAAALYYLGSYCRFLEIDNEPNGSVTGNPVPADPYANMCAWAAAWTWGLTSNSAWILAGSLKMPDSTDCSNDPLHSGVTSYCYRPYLQEVLAHLNNQIDQNWPTDAASIKQAYRVSFHPYPHRPATNVNTAIGDTESEIDDVLALTTNKVWITEFAASSNDPSADPTNCATDPNRSQPGLSLNGQRDYLSAISQYAAGKNRVEGLLWLTVSDNNALTHATDRCNGLYRSGVVQRDLGFKPAATWLAANW